jgi:hypothetical protein
MSMVAPDRSGRPASPVPESQFETSDFYLACYLRCAGYALLDIHRQGQRCIFVFADKPERRADTMAFFRGDGSVRALAFVGSIRELKALMYSDR